MNAMSPAQMVEAYIQLRDHVKAVEDAVKEELKRPREAMDKLEALMLDHLNQTGAKSLACDKGTVYRNTQMSATVATPLGAALVGGDVPGIADVLEWQASGATQTVTLQLPAAPGTSAGVDLGPVFHWLSASASIAW